MIHPFSPDSYEARGRATKVERFRTAIDQVILAFVEGMNDAAWERLAERIDANAPSEDTIAAIVAVYRERVETPVVIDVPIKHECPFCGEIYENYCAPCADLMDECEHAYVDAHAGDTR